jgi:broad specificity phosphatase PhoE
MKLFYIRHARSEFNEQGRMAGRCDPPLSTSGKEQALAIANILNGKEFDAIYSSPFKRALQTADPISKALSLPIKKNEHISELDMGDFSGEKWNDVIANYPKLFSNSDVGFWQLFSNDRIPNQERFASATDRVMKTIEELIAEHPNGKCIVVSHKGVLEILLSKITGFDPAFDWFGIGGASLTVIDFPVGKRPKFEMVNWTAVPF